MAVISGDNYTIIFGADNEVFLRTKRRHIKFKSYTSLYDLSFMVMDTIEWRIKVFNETYLEQVNDGLIQAFIDYNKWYDTRKSRAKIHLRMVAKLLYWHKQSVEKLWDPSNPDNHERILEIMECDL